MHDLLGKTIETTVGPVSIGFLRQECDAGIGTRQDNSAYLIRLSDRTVIRQVERDEDFDTAVLGAKPKLKSVPTRIQKVVDASRTDPNV
jgi:hypothetical protein